MKFTLAFVIVLLAACGSDSADNNGTGNNPQNPSGAGPAAVPLGAAGGSGSAGSYVILAETGHFQRTGPRVARGNGAGPAAPRLLTRLAPVARLAERVSASRPGGGE